MSTWRKVGCCLAMVAGLSFGASAALTIGTTDDPKATEVDLGNDVYRLEFKNGNAEPWTFTPMGPVRVEKMLVVGGGGSGGCDCGAGGGGGNALNCVVLGGYYTKKGTISYCALDQTPREESTSEKSYDYNVTVDSSIFEDTTAYRPKKGTALQGKGSNRGYAEHAVSATDYEGSPRRQGARIDIGHIELPPKDGTLLFVR